MSGVVPLPRGSSFAGASSVFAFASSSGLIMSNGSGNTTVEFWLTPISLSVCR